MFVIISEANTLLFVILNAVKDLFLRFLDRLGMTRRETRNDVLVVILSGVSGTSGVDVRKCEFAKQTTHCSHTPECEHPRSGATHEWGADLMRFLDKLGMTSRERFLDKLGMTERGSEYQKKGTE